MSCDPVQTWADPCQFGVESGCKTPGVVYCQPCCITHDCKASECIVRMRGERDALLKAAHLAHEALLHDEYHQAEEALYDAIDAIQAADREEEL